MNRLLHIVGNRPQFIKLAVLHRVIAEAGGISQEIIHTGQHSSAEMSDIFFRELSIPEPGIQLSLGMAGSGDEFIIAASNALEEIFSTLSSTTVMIYGDTNTTRAAARAANKARVPLLHFEAGIRTGDLEMPEEINRIAADRLANVNYCCTELNFQQMRSEGLDETQGKRVLMTGDLMYDAFLAIPRGSSLVTREKEYVVCTIHRAANILSKERLTAIIDGLNQIHQSIPVIVPLHPHTRKKIAEYALFPEFTIVAPLGYPDMKRLLTDSTFVVTDSGGTAREAFFSQKPAVIVMDRPFWPEIVDVGCALSVGAGREEIVNAFEGLSSLASNFQSPIFGDGRAAWKILEDINSNPF